MLNKAELLDIVKVYLDMFPDEVVRTNTFVAYLHRNGDDQLYTRKNFDGHITTSAFIIDSNGDEILLLRHKSLERWLQPGGHTEGDESLMASALREAVEETGIAATQLAYRPICENGAVPFDIDSHYIPPNPRKEEGGHYHHDIRYVFSYNGNRDNDFNKEEATGMKWLRFDSLTSDDTFGGVIEKIRASGLFS